MDENAPNEEAASGARHVQEAEDRAPRSTSNAICMNAKQREVHARLMESLPMRTHNNPRSLIVERKHRPTRLKSVKAKKK
jgi:hypothetical protein